MARKRPNVLLITTDQQHANTIHSLGNEAIKTPNLDKLARDGIAFTRAYTANPVCSPSRSSILTGEYPSRHGCWNIGVQLNENRSKMSTALHEHGYSTALFGKAHFSPVLAQESFEAPPHIYDRSFWKDWHGPYYGFEEVSMVHGHADESSSQGMHYGVWLEDHGVDTSKYFGPGGGFREGAWDLPEELHYTRWTADQTIEYLERQTDNDSPFFAWCSFQDPHNSFLCPEPWNSLYSPDDVPDFITETDEMSDKPLIHQLLIDNRLDELDVNITSDPGHPTKGIQCLGNTTNAIGIERAKSWLASYYGMISLIDHHVGRVLEKLDALGMAEDTIVIFTSDHGDYAGNHGLWLKGPIHYEDVIRVPLLIKWKGELPENVVTSSLFSLVDLAPTILDAAGVAPLSSCQGYNQFSTLQNPHTPTREWCLIENRAEPDFYVKTVVTERYKLNYFLERGEGELYDLESDPHEFTNLFNNSEYSDIKLQLLQKLIDIHGNMENLYPERLSFA